LAVAEQDFAINAQVRRALARRWIRSECLDIGTTDGVVLVKGRLELEPGGSQPVDRERLIRRLRTDLTAIPGVMDIVMEFHRGEQEAAR
jgi:hypothetical protein